MRSIIVAVAASVFVLGAAQAKDTWYTYVGADYQHASLSYKTANEGYLPSSLSQGANFHIGERFTDYYAVELGYAGGSDRVDGRLAATSTDPATNYTGKIDVHGPTLDLYGYMPLFKSKLSVFATGGVSYLTGKATIEVGSLNGQPFSFESSKSEFGYRVGGGVEWRFIEEFSIRATARYQSADFGGLMNNAIVGQIGVNFYF